MLLVVRLELSEHLLEILYHDGVDLNTWFKDKAAICNLFGALDRVGDAHIPTGCQNGSTLVGSTAAFGCELFLVLLLSCQFLLLAWHQFWSAKWGFGVRTLQRGPLHPVCPLVPHTRMLIRY